MDDEALAALAAQLQGDAEEIRRLPAPLRASIGPSVLAGGRLADSVDEVVELSVQAGRDLAATVEGVAARVRATEPVT